MEGNFRISTMQTSRSVFGLGQGKRTKGVKKKNRSDRLPKESDCITRDFKTVYMFVGRISSVALKCK